MDINITILGQIISFIIFVVFCMKYVWPPIISIIEKRQKEISDMFDDIEKKKQEAEIKFIKASNCLEQAKLKAQSIIARAHQYETQLIDQTKYDVQFERKRILSQAYKDIEIKKKCIAEKLQHETGCMIIAGIEKILEHPIDQSIHDNIISSVLKDLSYCSINGIHDKEKV